MKRLHDDVTSSSEGCGETERNFECGEIGRLLMSPNLMLQTQILYHYIIRHCLSLGIALRNQKLSSSPTSDDIHVYIQYIYL